MYATTLRTETTEPRPEPSTPRTTRATTITHRTDDNGITWLEQDGIREWARHAHAANGFGDAAID